jgi:hypothetical protein
MNDVVFVMANSRLSKKKKARKAPEMQFEDVGFDDDWVMDEEVDATHGRTEIEEDVILVDNLEDEHDDGGRDENEYEDDFDKENEYEGDDGEDSEDADQEIDDPLGDYDKLQHELFGN